MTGSMKVDQAQPSTSLRFSIPREGDFCTNVRQLELSCHSAPLVTAVLSASLSRSTDDGGETTSVTLRLWLNGWWEESQLSLD